MDSGVHGSTNGLVAEQEGKLLVNPFRSYHRVLRLVPALIPLLC